MARRSSIVFARSELALAAIANVLLVPTLSTAQREACLAELHSLQRAASKPAIAATNAEVERLKEELALERKEVLRLRALFARHTKDQC